jgi:hypothetical protein
MTRGAIKTESRPIVDRSQRTLRTAVRIVLAMDTTTYAARTAKPWAVPGSRPTIPGSIRSSVCSTQSEGGTLSISAILYEEWLLCLSNGDDRIDSSVSRRPRRRLTDADKTDLESDALLTHRNRKDPTLHH